ncbi:MTOR-associated protein MEAK7 [Anguilla anguilla]|uniref:MTOR-associated protein MEAK7 n=1 Tax=Anguilla anguilla TaxID=7936 RepID=UPI0015AE078A|nr:MTOR-associated protein MEAK7 [Anguilla anguilla]
MGNTESAVVQKRMVRFRPEERPVVERVFDQLLEAGSGNAPGSSGKVLTLDALKVCVAGVAPESMTVRLFQAMRSVDPGGTAPPGGGVSREQLLVFLADVLRGTAEERAPLVMAMARREGEATVTADQVREFVEDLVSAVVQILTSRGRREGWRPDRMGDSAQGVKLLAEQMSSELKLTDERSCDVPCLEDWLFRVSGVALYLELVTSEGLGVRLPSRPPLPLLPSCGPAPWDELRSLLDLPLLLFLYPQLPAQSGAPWRLLFSTRLHGESFTRLVGCCARRGPTLLLLRDSDGHQFGGFASQSWDTKPQFQGDSRCFLFSVFPTLRVYTCTGYNQHYMYLNQGQQTMPNGLGMGGQHHYFGLWLDSDFGKGHSRARPRCTTYGSPQLSAQENFTVETLEVWGVGDPPEEQQAQGKRSVLDADPETQAIMEMTGKTLHSQGLREPEEEEL